MSTRRKCINKKLCTGVCLTLLLALSETGHSRDTTSNAGPRSNRAFISLSYVPAYGGVSDFEIGAANNGTKAVLPYKHTGASGVLKAENFDWTATDTRITFGNSTGVAISGSLGYARKNARVEIEVGYERFATKLSTDGKSKQNDPGYFILSKAITYDIVKSNTERLRENFAALSAEEVETFARVLHSAHPDVDRMICKKGKKVLLTDRAREYLTPPTYGKPFGGRDEIGANCNGKERPEDGRFLYEAKDDPGLMAAVTHDGRGKWPNVSKTDAWYRGDRSPEVDSTEQVVGDIAGMSPDSKAIVAGHIAQAVEGGEVVEIRSVSSTSVMINACYDAALTNMDFVPYACLGFGGNLVGVAGSVFPKLAYKLKAGISYSVSDRVAAYVGGFLHHVISDGEYRKLPVYKLVDDISPEGRTGKSATASFGLSYAGYEMGFRLMF